MVWTAYTDSFIGCMNAKYHFSFWRPATAIPNGDLSGNSATVADPRWTALGATPNHPEYPAAHGCVSGAVAATVESFFGTPDVVLIVNSAVTNTTHTFTHISQLEREVFGARIYAGFHYRHSLEQGFLLGHRVAGHLTRRLFPTFPRSAMTGSDANRTEKERSNEVACRFPGWAWPSGLVCCINREDFQNENISQHFRLDRRHGDGDRRRSRGPND
jgi:hypothetical protein